MSITDMASSQSEYLRQMRRELHKIPESGNMEFKTRALLIDELKKSGADVIRDIAQTGIKAVFYGADRSKAIAFRAELDALSVEESNQTDYRSHNDTMMHACGHDGHMSILLGLAKIVGENKDKLGCSVVLLFEPDEEGLGGAKRMINEGALSDPAVGEIYAIHMMPQLPKGTFGIKSGALMAESLEFSITINGKSTHGATPEKGIDAITAAAELILGMQTIIPKNVSSGENAVLTVGRIEGGTSLNTIAAQARLSGIIRSYDSEICKNIRKQILKRLESLEIVHSVKCEFTELINYPVVLNDAKLAVIASHLTDYEILEPEPVMMAEDFSYFQMQVPGLMIFLGTGDTSRRLHSDDFDFDESILVTGLSLYLKLLWKGIECFEVV